MSAIHLNSYSTVCWRPGKSGGVDVVGSLPVPTNPRHPSLSASDGAASALVLACIKQPKQELALWLSWKGCQGFHKPPKIFHNVLHLCAEDTHLGVFYTRHHGKDVSFALVERSADDTTRLTGPTKTFAAGVMALLDDFPSVNGAVAAASTKGGARFAVRDAVLRRTTRGFVVAAVVSVTGGESQLYGIVGHLATNVWRKWKIEGGHVHTPCIFIPQNGVDVRFVRCDVAQPLHPTATAHASSTRAALSTFARVSQADVSTAESHAAAAAPPSFPSLERIGCAVFCECVVPTGATAPVTERCYQSHTFALSEQEVAPYSCLAVVEEKTSPVYTIIVPGHRGSYIVHVSYAVGGADLIACAAAVPELHKPVSVCRLRLPTHQQRPHGTSLSVVLCGDMRVYACEHFGSAAAAVVLRINNVPSAAMAFPFVPPTKGSKKATAVGASTVVTATRLLSVLDGSELLCTNGMLGVFFRVSAAMLAGAAPSAPLTLPDPFVSLSAATPGVEDAGSGTNEGAVALRRCLAHLDALSLRCTRHDLPDAVFREVLPFLRCVGTSQLEVMLVQRVFERLLSLAVPILQSEWSYLWALTSVLQRTLTKHSADNAVCYTDAFFLELAETYRNSAFANTEGTSAVGDAVRADVSPEAAGVLTSAPAHFPAEVHYVLDGLAAGVPPLDLAEEVARRMVHTETLANGTCVVSAPPGKAGCVHGMGCVLLASCLDVHVAAYAVENCEMRVCVQPSSLQPPSADAPRTACVSVAPHAFDSQAEFEKALTLAADLLCVSTGDASFRPDLALLALAIGTRAHCLTAFAQLFAPVLQGAVEEVMPLANNTAWLEAAAAALSRTFAESAAALLSEERSTGLSLTTALVFVLFGPRYTFNVPFFHTLTQTTSEDFCTTAVVACVLHQTERLVAATHNYAAVVATSLLGKGDAAEQAAAQTVAVGRQRLRATLAQTLALWSHVNALSPYRVRDVAASYCMSARNSIVSAAGGGGEGSGQGTVASRSLVACFRLLCLVQHSCNCEAEARKAGEMGLERCAAVMVSLYSVKEAPVPLEWYQRLFLEAVRTASTKDAEAAPFLLRLLELSNVRQTGSAALKRDFYRVLDSLERQSTQAAPPAAVDAAVAALAQEAKEAQQRTLAAAESDVTALTLQEEILEGRQSNASHSTASFIFSAMRDASLPRWAASHAVAERRYLFSQVWTEVLWAVERLPDALGRLCERTLHRISSAPNAGAAAGVSEPPVPLSAEMSLPLFEQLCRLRPPVRVHAVAPRPFEAAVTVNSNTATAAAGVAGVSGVEVQRQSGPADILPTQTASPSVVPPAAVVPAARDGGAATTVKSQAPVDGPLHPAPSLSAVVPVPSAVVPAASSPLVAPPPRVAEAPLLPAASHAPAVPESRIVVEHVSPPLRPQQQLQGQKRPSTASSPPAPPAETVTPHPPSLYAPADVAWWETIGVPASPSRGATIASATTPPPEHQQQQQQEHSVVGKGGASSSPSPAGGNTATCDDNGVSSDTATSYTTSTSNYRDPMEVLSDYARKGNGPNRRRGNRRSSSSSSRGSSGSGGVALQRHAMCSSPRQSALAPPCKRRAGAAKRKKCRCCIRDVHHRSSHSGWAAPRDPLEASFALRWREGPVETTMTPLRPPPAMTTRAVEAARPTLLSFSSRLQPPEEPPRPFAESARAAASHVAGVTPAQSGPGQLALLRLPSTSATTREPSRVRLYTLNSGERVKTAGGGDIVPLHSGTNMASRGVLGGHAAGQLTVPAVPPSSVFVAPPPLLHLPQQTPQERSGMEQQQPPQQQSLGGRVVAVRDANGTAGQSYAQVVRDPVGPAPPAVDVSTLHQSSGTAVPAATPAVPPVTVSDSALPVPLPPSPSPAGLSPSQLADFHRYTDNLLARHTAPPQAAASPATTPSTPAPAAAAVAPLDCPGVSRLVEQQDDFIRKAEALLQTQQAQNEGFYRRVVESIRSLTTASQQLRGLTPVEQSQLVRDTVKQRNELMSLNHQLLDMQLAAARVTKEPPTAGETVPGSGSSFPTTAATTAPFVTTSEGGAVPGAVSNGAALPVPAASLAARTSVGVTWSSPPAPAAALTSVDTQTPTVPTVGMQATLTDLQRLNTELMGVNASAAAMDRAIQETRDVIQRYERSKASEALSAEGVALTAAMRLRTAAIEQRLSELPRRTPQTTDTSAVTAIGKVAVVTASPPSRLWTSQSFSPVDIAAAEGASPAPRDRLAEQQQQREGPAAAVQSSPPSISQPQPPSPVAAAPLVTLQAPSVAPMDAAHATRLRGAEPLHAPLAAADESAVQPSIASTPSPAFTSVSSTAIAEDVTTTANTAAAATPAPTSTPPAALWAPPTFGAGVPRSPSISFEQRHPHMGDAAPAPVRVYTQPSDLRTLFVQAGGSSALRSAAQTPPKAAARRRVAPPAPLKATSLVPRSTTHRRPSPQSSGLSAVYRNGSTQRRGRRATVAAGVPSSCLPLSYAQSARANVATPAEAPGAIMTRTRSSAADAVADRQRDRRVSGIQRRMEQLEHDLFG